MSNNTKTTCEAQLQDRNEQQTTKIIEIGKFYFIYDGSRNGHPGLVVWKDDFHNLYLVIKFGTTKNKENFIFKYPIGGKAKQSFVYKRFCLFKRKDISKTVLFDLNVKDNDLHDLINKMDYLNPKYSKNISGRDRHFYRRNIKKTLFYKGNCPTQRVLLDSNNIQVDSTIVNKNKNNR